MRKHNGVRWMAGTARSRYWRGGRLRPAWPWQQWCGVVEAGTAWAEESAEFPQTMHFAVSMANMNLSENDLPAFRYGFSGFREANPTVPGVHEQSIRRGAGVLPRQCRLLHGRRQRGSGRHWATRGIR